MRFAASTRVTRAACAWILAALAACSSDPVELEAGQACGDGPDLDGDGRVGACDPCPEDPLDDVDGDGVCGGVDNCPTAPNADQVDSDGDGSGDACDCGVDSDGDGVCDAVDPCPSVVGDVCPPCSDRDDDGVCDAFDLCPDDPENGCLPQCAAATFADVDQDGVDDGCDACPGDAGNDPDQDGVCAALDDCPGAADPGQEDLDGDGFGDACEPACDDSGDGDHDGVCDDVDDCPDVADPLQLDLDHDGLGIACDGAESLPAAFDAAHSAVALAARGTTSAVLGRSGDGATPASLVIVGVDRLRRLSLPAGAAAPFVAADGRVWTSGDRLRRESVDGLEDLGLPARVLADAPVAASGDAPGVLALRSAEGGGEVLEVWDAAGPRTVATATAFTGLTVGPSWLEVVRHEPGGDELALAEADGAAAVVRSASAIQALEPLAAGRGDHVWCATTASGCDVFLTLGATLPAASEVSLGVGCGAVTVVRDDGGTPWIVAWSGHPGRLRAVRGRLGGGRARRAAAAAFLAHTPPPGVSAAVIACAATPPAVCVEVWKASAGVAVRLGALGGAPFGAAFGPAGELAVATNRDLGFERGGSGRRRPICPRPT
ncbi:MAG: thrombospondin type 3 repeat-containing protein [Myxococcota bacterium]